MDLTALTWQASTVLIYRLIYREAGVAKATLASFCAQDPAASDRRARFGYRIRQRMTISSCRRGGSKDFR